MNNRTPKKNELVLLNDKIDFSKNENQLLLFFDTETSGLPRTWNASVYDLDNWPRLVQLAYQVYDFHGNLICTCNEIIKPDGFVIPIEASNIHKITSEIANERGSRIENVLEVFLIYLNRATVIVGHNLEYDEKIIGSELIRLGLDNELENKQRICTMKSTVDLCKIEGPFGYKWPTLQELHEFLFNSKYDDSQNALSYIQATARCFWALVARKNVDLTNNKSIKLSNENEGNNINDSNVPF